MKEFESLIELDAFIDQVIIREIAIQGIDLTEIEEKILSTQFVHCLFLGCPMNDRIRTHLHSENYIFPIMKMPFNIYPNALYTRETLYENYDPNKPESYKLTPDYLTYDHYIRNAKASRNIKETLAKRLHDHSITDALHGFLEKYDDTKIVGIMGGHGILRGSESYMQAVEISRRLTRDGYLMVSGGGPGAMEATHVGAWFADKDDNSLEEAMNIPIEAPKYSDREWLSTAFKVLKMHPDCTYESVGIPTWHYGH
jgi:hypothetical protein